MRDYYIGVIKGDTRSLDYGSNNKVSHILNPNSMYDNSPKPPITAIKAIILHTFGVQNVHRTSYSLKPLSLEVVKTSALSPNRSSLTLLQVQLMDPTENPKPCRFRV